MKVPLVTFPAPPGSVSGVPGARGFESLEWNERPTAGRPQGRDESRRAVTLDCTGSRSITLDCGEFSGINAFARACRSSFLVQPRCDLRFRIARGNILRAVPIEAHGLDEEQPLDLVP